MSTIHLISEQLASAASQPYSLGVLREHVTAAASQPRLQSSGDLTEWATNKTSAWGTLLRLITSVLAAPGFVLYHAIKSRGAMARILVAILTSALVLWGVYSVTENQDRITQEVNSDPVVGAYSAAVPLAPLIR